MSRKPSIDTLTDVCRLLGIELLWDPNEWPMGPTEAARPQLVAALTVYTEAMRSWEFTPETLTDMIMVHGRGLSDSAHVIIQQSMAALSYHSEVLNNMGGSDTCADAVGIVRAAVGILASGLTGNPYLRVLVAGAVPGDDGTCRGCGKVH